MSDSDSDDNLDLEIVPDDYVSETERESTDPDDDDDDSDDDDGESVAEEMDVLLRRPMYKAHMKKASEDVKNAELKAAKAEVELAALRKTRFIPGSLNGKFAELEKFLEEIPDADKKVAAGVLLKRIVRDFVAQGRVVVEGAPAAPPAPIVADNLGEVRSLQTRLGLEEKAHEETKLDLAKAIALISRLRRNFSQLARSVEAKKFKYGPSPTKPLITTLDASPAPQSGARRDRTPEACERPEPPDKIVQCPYCEEKVSYLKTAVTHVLNVHKNKTRGKKIAEAAVREANQGVDFAALHRKMMDRGGSGSQTRRRADELLAQAAAASPRPAAPLAAPRVRPPRTTPAKSCRVDTPVDERSVRAMHFLYRKGVPMDALVLAFGLSHVTVLKHACDPLASIDWIRRQPKDLAVSYADVIEKLETFLKERPDDELASFHSTLDGRLSYSTVYRLALCIAQTRAPVKVNYLSPELKEKRVKWAQELQVRIPQERRFMSRLWISDEKMFVCFKTTTKSRIWVLHDAPLENRIRECAKMGSKRGAMCWLAINADLGTSEVFWLDPKLTIDGKVYQGIVEEFFVKEAKKTFEHCAEKAIFQQDNASCHTSKPMREYFAKQEAVSPAEGGFTLFPWPARSPDLSPIEHFWAWIEHQRPKDGFDSVDALKRWVSALVASPAGQSKAKLLMSTFESRVQKVIDINGDALEKIRYITDPTRAQQG
jgi:hypothetical protein